MPDRIPSRRVPCALVAAALTLALASGAAAERASAPRRGARGALLLADTFDAHDVARESAALNAALGARQSGPLAPSRYARRSGVWFRAPSAAPELAGVLPVAGGGALAFRGPAAVRTDASFALEAGRALRVTARVDPVSDDVEGLSWVSIVLSPDPASAGWVLGPEVLAALLVRSNGAIDAHSRGVGREARWLEAAPVPAHGYDVSLEVRLAGTPEAPALVMEGSVAGAPFASTLGLEDEAALPAAVHLFLGAHFHEGDAPLSVVDDLRVERVRR